MYVLGTQLVGRVTILTTSRGISALGVGRSTYYNMYIARGRERGNPHTSVLPRSMCHWPWRHYWGLAIPAFVLDCQSQAGSGAKSCYRAGLVAKISGASGRRAVSQIDSSPPLRCYYEYIVSGVLPSVAYVQLHTTTTLAKRDGE